MIQLAYAVSRSTYHSGRVRLVYHNQGVVFLGKVANFIHRSHVAVHRKDTVRNDDTETLCLSFLQAFFQFSHIGIGVAVAFCFAKTHTVDDGSMVQ